MPFSLREKLVLCSCLHAFDTDRSSLLELGKRLGWFGHRLRNEELSLGLRALRHSLAILSGVHGVGRRDSRFRSPSLSAWHYTHDCLSA